MANSTSFTLIFLTFFDLFATVFMWLVLIRVLLSWVAPGGGGSRFNHLLVDLTEPVLGPLRRLIPLRGLDISPLVALILIQILRSFLHQTLL